MFAIIAAVIVAGAIIWTGNKMTQALDNLTASVAAVETATRDAVAEIASLKVGSDDTALTALKDRLDAVAANLTAAVAPGG